MTKDMAPIVLVHLGKSLPRFVRLNLNYLSRTFKREIHLLTSVRDQKLYKFTELPNPIQIHNINSLDVDWQNAISSNYRDNFWEKTKKRIYIVCSFLESMGIVRAIHIENDVWIAPYASIDLAFSEGNIAYPILNDGRGVGSSIFFDDREGHLLRKMKKYFSEYPEKTDMEILGILHRDNPDEFLSLPSNEFDIGRAEFIYDGAFIGMHIFGEDPRNRFGKFKINSDYEAFGGKLSELNFFLDDESKLIAESTRGKSIVGSLHIHSKLGDIFTKNPSKVLKIRLEARSQSQKSRDVFSFVGFLQAIFDYSKLLPNYLKKRLFGD
jgi:hypothetical protein